MADLSSGSPFSSAHDYGIETPLVSYIYMWVIFRGSSLALLLLKTNEHSLRPLFTQQLLMSLETHQNDNMQGSTPLRFTESDIAALPRRCTLCQKKRD